MTITDSQVSHTYFSANTPSKNIPPLGQYLYYVNKENHQRARHSLYCEL